MARKSPKKSPRYELSVTYGGELFRFVDKFEHELLPEIVRLKAAVDQCIDLAGRCRRQRHPLIEATYTHLRLIRPNVEAADLPKEICRVNLSLDDGLKIINRLKFCDLESVQRLRFALTYSQTHRKKDRAGFKEDKDLEYANRNDESDSERIP